MKHSFFRYFIISCFTAASLLSCSKDDKNENPQESFDESYLIETIAQVILDSGLEFPQPEPPADRGEGRSSDLLALASDYMVVDIGDGETMTAKMWLGANNHVIPSLKWKNENPNFCSDQGLEMRPALKMFKFTIHNAPEQDIRTVQLNYIDVDTGIIEHSVISDNYGPDPDWLYAAMSMVWAEMMDLVNAQGALGPCIDGDSLTLRFKSTVTNVTPEAQTYEEIKVTVSLQYDESIDAYTGIGEFEWIEGWLQNEELGTIPFPTVKSGALEVVKLITPSLTGGSINDATMIFKAPRVTAADSSMLFVSFMAFYDMISGDDNTFTYRFDDWQTSSNPDIVMKANTNNHLEDDDAVLTETSSFEIFK